jgi:glycosyltransferase involved in cell wall biosynthesis
MPTITINGIVGVPASYGGFETLAENLVRYHVTQGLSDSLNVYCSGPAYANKPRYYLSAKLHYLPLSANGAQSIPYDIWSLISAVLRGTDRILLLGVSGAVALPIIRLLSRARIVTNIDGIEWRREKWRGAAKWFLRFSEHLAVRYSHEVVADNAGIADYVRETYGRECHVIAYGGDHAISVDAKPYPGENLPAAYAFALCRIEPENNVGMILEAFTRQTEMPLVFVGNWNNSDYGRELRARFGNLSHILLLDPIYDLGILRTLRGNAALYVHGHSAGGTNPSLVEMMHFGLPVLAFDCVFNRYTTDGKAIYFANVEQLTEYVGSLDAGKAARVGAEMLRIARERYTWDAIGTAYFDLLAHQVVP